MITALLLPNANVTIAGTAVVSTIPIHLKTSVSLLNVEIVMITQIV